MNVRGANQYDRFYKRGYDEEELAGDFNIKITSPNMRRINFKNNGNRERYNNSYRKNNSRNGEIYTDEYGPQKRIWTIIKLEEIGSMTKKNKPRSGYKHIL